MYRASQGYWQKIHNSVHITRCYRVIYLHFGIMAENQVADPDQQERERQCSEQQDQQVDNNCLYVRSPHGLIRCCIG